MKDFRGKELAVGDNIIYATSYSNHVSLNETTIVAFEDSKETSWGTPYKVILVKNPNWTTESSKSIPKNVRLQVYDGVAHKVIKLETTSV